MGVSTPGQGGAVEGFSWGKPEKGKGMPTGNAHKAAQSKLPKNLKVKKPKSP
jgi:hypothetical protein